MPMRILATIFLGAVVAVAVAGSLHALNVKTGLWQISETITWTGLPPQMAAAMGSGRVHSYNSCVKKEDLTTNPWAGGSRESCKWTVLSSTGTDMEVQGSSCDMGAENGMTAQIHGQIHVLDPEDGTGSFDIALMGNGQAMNGHVSYMGKWVGPSCPAE